MKRIAVLTVLVLLAAMLATSALAQGSSYGAMVAQAWYKGVLKDEPQTPVSAPDPLPPPQSPVKAKTGIFGLSPTEVVISFSIMIIILVLVLVALTWPRSLGRPDQPRSASGGEDEHVDVGRLVQPMGAASPPKQESDDDNEHVDVGRPDTSPPNRKGG